MAEEIVDIIHRLNYEVHSEEVERVSRELQAQLARIEQLKQRSAQLSAAYSKTADTEIAKRERIRQLIIRTQSAIEKEGDAVEHTVLNNDALNKALQKQLGIVTTLDQKLELLRVRRDRAFDVDKIKQYNKLIADGEYRRSIYAQIQPQFSSFKPNPQPQPETSGFTPGKLIGAVAGGNILGGLITNATAALKDFAVDVVSTTAKYEKLTELLSNTLGGRAAGAEAFSMLADFAAETPFQLDELTSSYLKLVNRGIKPTKEELAAFGDIAAAQGKSFDQFTEAILDATTGEFERLKEFGIKAKQSGDQVTLAFGNITKTVPKSSDAIKKALIEIRNQAPGIAGAMKVISGTIEGQLSNLGDGFDRLKNTIGGRFQQDIKSGLSLISDFVAGLNSLVEVPVTEKIEAERIEVNALVLSLTDLNLSNDRRSEIISELNQKYPELVRNLDLETASQANLIGFLKSVNALYRERIKVAGFEAVTKKAQGDAVDNSTEIAERLSLARRALTQLGVDENKAVELLNKPDKLRSFYNQGRVALREEARNLGIAEDEIGKGLGDLERALNGFMGLSVIGVSKSLETLNDRQLEYNKSLEEAIKLQQQQESASKTLNEATRRQLEEDLTSLTKRLDNLKKLGLEDSMEALELRKQLQQSVFELNPYLSGDKKPEAKAAASTSATTAKAKAKKDVDPYQKAVKEENDRFEAEMAKRQEYYDLLRIEARKKYGDNEKKLASELLKIKEQQELDSYERTTGNTNSHLNLLYEVYRKFHKLRSADAAKNTALITKNEEDEARRRAEIAARTRKQQQADAQAVLDGVNQRIKATEERLKKEAESRLRTNEEQRNLALLGANILTGGSSIDKSAEARGGQILTNIDIKIPKDTGDQVFEDVSRSIHEVFNRKKLEVEVANAKIELQSVTMSGGSKEDIKKAEQAVTEAEAKLTELRKEENKKPKYTGAEKYELLSNAAVAAYQRITEASREAMEAQIAHQERRVEQAQKIADRGNAELLQREEERLRKLNKQKEEAAKRELIINQALALSNAIVAVAKAAAEGATQGGYGAIGTIAATLGALAAGYVLVRTMTTDTPAFRDGVIDLQGPGTTKSDSIHARLSRGESVMTAEATARYKPILEDMNRLSYRPELPNYDRPIAKEIVESQAAMQLNYRNDFLMLRKELQDLKEIIASKPDTSFTMDERGFRARQMQMIWREERNRNL